MDDDLDDFETSLFVQALFDEEDEEEDEARARRRRPIVPPQPRTARPSHDGAALRALRLQYGVTPSDLAAELSISVQALMAIESDTAPVAQQQVWAILVAVTRVAGKNGTSPS